MSDHSIPLSAFCFYYGVSLDEGETAEDAVKKVEEQEDYVDRKVEYLEALGYFDD